MTGGTGAGAGGGGYYGGGASDSLGGGGAGSSWAVGTPHGVTYANDGLKFPRVTISPNIIPLSSARVPSRLRSLRPCSWSP